MMADAGWLVAEAGSNLPIAGSTRLNEVQNMAVGHLSLRRLIAFLFLSLGANEARANEHDASLALQAWNNFLEAVNISDACTGKNDIDALRALSARARIAQSILIDRYPNADPSADTDYICNSEGMHKRTDRRALRKAAENLIAQIEIEATR